MACSKGQLVASNSEILDLLRLCTMHLPGHFIILDGIDECIDSEFLSIEICRSDWGRLANIMVFSRPTVWYPPATIHLQTLDINRKNQRDIREYSCIKLDELIERGRFPQNLGAPGEVTKEQLLSSILLGADGMFLWATLLFEYLQSRALSEVQRVEIIMSIKHPERLDDMYARIVRKIDEQISDEKDLTQRIFTWIIFARWPLRLEEMKIAVSLIMNHDHHQKNTDREFASTAKILSGALVEQVPMGGLSFIHLSAHDYVRNLFTRKYSSSYASVFPRFKVLEAECLALNQCLKFMKQLISHLGGIRDTPSTTIAERFPFANYAAVNWFEHLSETMAALHVRMEALDFAESRDFNHLETITSTLDTLDSAISFFKEASFFQLWLQLYYSFRESITRIAIRLQLYSGHPNQAPTRSNHIMDQLVKLRNTLVDLGRTMQDIERDWGDHLLDNPSFIWQPEIAAFTPNQFLTADPSIVVDVLEPTRPGNSRLAQTYSQKKTVLGKDGEFLLSLSIWPSA
jgi:hypothetical protein